MLFDVLVLEAVAVAVAAKGSKPDWRSQKTIDRLSH
jgi:hypothetical protein